MRCRFSKYKEEARCSILLAVCIGIGRGPDSALLSDGYQGDTSGKGFIDGSPATTIGFASRLAI